MATYIPPAYPRPKRRTAFENLIPALTQMFASGLMGQKLWEKRQGITAEAEEKKDIRTRQQHLEDLGYPSYDPMKEPMEAWGPEVKKVGEKYYGEPTPKPILGRQGGLLGHEYKGAMLKPAIPKVPKIDKIDTGTTVEVLRDGKPWKTYEKGELPGKGNKISMSKILKSGFVNQVSIDPEKEQSYMDRGYTRGTLKEMKGKDLTKDKAQARKRISQIETDFAELKTKGVTDETLTRLSPQAQGLISMFKDRPLSKEDLDRIQEVYQKEIQGLIKSYGLTEYKRKAKPKIQVPAGDPLGLR